ncbi:MULTISPECIES: hypothetical protein [unclassified Streptomyces]|uniref:hypothetical protein n=1 Tax=unclassified Streptomyces TaxID=2593676 RepID=UPI0006F8BB82|nr:MULTISPECIES: hypothetical protein [unclassified Streptomyces]KQX47544.1 hypothetical protein ASD33_21015 [Streptomyces sp. Root1304]KRA94824.1 hypothetical protein ASE09_30230 [Streptomyces sp. Root66D1]
MTMPPSPSQPPHQPYGGPVPPPQQPGAYGAPQGFPQQGHPPYGAPPQYPGPGAGAWGQPPMGPPPKKKMSSGAIVAIVLGSLVLVGGLGYAAKAGLEGVTGTFPEATHKLVVPKTLLDGKYTLVSDLSDTKGQEIEDTPDLTVKDATAAVAQYSGKDGAVLVLSGMYGRIKSGEASRTSILEGAAKDKGSTLVVEPKEFTPAGSDVTVSCQVTTSKSALGTTTLPMCAWGDDNTAAAVALVDPTSATTDPKDIDLAALAETTAKVRAETRKPLI